MIDQQLSNTIIVFLSWFIIIIPKIIQNGQAVPEIFKYVSHEVLNRYQEQMSSGGEVTGYDLHSNELLMWPQAALLLYAQQQTLSELVQLELKRSSYVQTLIKLKNCTGGIAQSRLFPVSAKYFIGQRLCHLNVPGHNSRTRIFFDMRFSQDVRQSPPLTPYKKSEKSFEPFFVKV